MLNETRQQKPSTKLTTLIVAKPPLVAVVSGTVTRIDILGQLPVGLTVFELGLSLAGFPLWAMFLLGLVVFGLRSVMRVMRFWLRLFGAGVAHRIEWRMEGIARVRIEVRS